MRTKNKIKWKKKENKNNRDEKHSKKKFYTPSPGGAERKLASFDAREFVTLFNTVFYSNIISCIVKIVNFKRNLYKILVQPFENINLIFSDTVGQANIK